MLGCVRSSTQSESSPTETNRFQSELIPAQGLRSGLSAAKVPLTREKKERKKRRLGLTCGRNEATIVLFYENLLPQSLYKCQEHGFPLTGK